MPSAGMEDVQQIKIAMITFAFDNAKVINWLRYRGTCIKNEDWDGLKATNETIQNALKTDQELLDKLQRPCAAFVTFESEEGHARATNYEDVVNSYRQFQRPEYTQFLGGPFKMIEASEPTDIIWENRGFTEEERTRKKGTVTIVIISLLLLSFFLIFILQKKAQVLKGKYPAIPCENVQDRYQLHNDAWKRDAIKEYLYNSRQEQEGLSPHYSGVMQCFCNIEKA